MELPPPALLVAVASEGKARLVTGHEPVCRLLANLDWTLPLLSFSFIMASSSSPSLGSGDLVDLVSTSSSATVHPTDDAILQVLQASFRVDRPYFRINTSNLVVVNPFKALANTNDNSAKEYEERCYKDTSSTSSSSQPPLPPHPYDLAARAYLLMRRRGESQAVLFR
jgi:chitin synthase